MDRETRDALELFRRLSEEDKDLIIEVLREYIAGKKKRSENENEAK